jgi:succinoglycan biosynthesis protein ExoL
MERTDVDDETSSSDADGRRLFFFCPDITDATTMKRAQQFIEHGLRVIVFGFRRERYNSGYAPPWPHVELGMTADARYWQRLSALLGALPVIFSHRLWLRRASVFYARNIDQLVLTMLARWMSGNKAPVAYEVLDIQPALMGRSPGAVLLRFIERLCLRHVRLLVLSSPGFHRSYFSMIQKYRGEWFLMENKLHTPIAAAADIRARPFEHDGRRPWVIGYFGLIRGEATFELMTRLAARLGDKVEFKFRGILTTVDETGFHDALARHSNMSFGGPYRPHDDLPALYGDVDFAWALDLENTNHNSRWLLPCRFYEAGHFGVPCLAVHGFEFGALVEEHRIGWTFGQPLEERLARFFQTLTPDAYRQMRDRLLARPQSTFVANEDVTALSAALERLAAAGPAAAESARRPIRPDAIATAPAPPSRH